MPKTMPLIMTGDHEGTSGPTWANGWRTHFHQSQTWGWFQSIFGFTFGFITWKTIGWKAPWRGSVPFLLIFFLDIPCITGGINNLSSKYKCLSSPREKTHHRHILGCSAHKWRFPARHGVSLKWLVFVRENPTKMNDLGVPPFQETSILRYTQPSYLTLISNVVLMLNHSISRRILLPPKLWERRAAHNGGISSNSPVSAISHPLIVPPWTRIKSK